MSLLDVFRRPTRRADPAVRRSAIAGLADAAEITRLALTDPDLGVRVAALARCPSAMALVWSALHAPEVPVREAALRALSTLPDPWEHFGVEVDPEIERLLYRAREALGVDPDALGRAIVALLDKEDVPELRSLILGLTSEPGRVMLAVSHHRPDVRADAAHSVGPTAELIEALLHADPAYVAEALRCLGEDDDLERVVRHAEHEGVALLALAKMKDPSRLRALVHADVPVAVQAAAMARADDLPFIHTVAASRAPLEVRVAAVRRMMSRRSAEQLRALLTDREPAIRRLALERWDTVTPSNLTLPNALVSRLASDSDPACRALALSHVLDAVLLETRASTDPDPDARAAAVRRLAEPWATRTRRIEGADAETRHLALRWLGRDVARHFAGMSLDVQHSRTDRGGDGKGGWTERVSDMVEVRGRFHGRPARVSLSASGAEAALRWQNPLVPVRLQWDPRRAPRRMSNDDTLGPGQVRVFVDNAVFVEGPADGSVGVTASLSAWEAVPAEVAGEVGTLMASLKVAELRLDAEELVGVLATGCFELPDPVGALDTLIGLLVRVHNAVVLLPDDRRQGPVRVVRCAACTGRFNAAARVSCPSCGAEVG